MKYLNLLNHSFEQVKETVCDGAMGKFEYLASYIFGFVTYENVISSLMAQKCLEVCKAISDRKTFEYIGTEEGNFWFLITVNMPFFECKLSWGTSIRGAFWDRKKFMVKSCGLFDGFNQILELEVDWVGFVEDMISFSKEEWK